MATNTIQNKTETAYALADLTVPGPVSQFPRKHPPIGSYDTVKAFRTSHGHIEWVSVHGSCLIFQDHEIIKVHPAIRHETLTGGVNVDFTEFQKAIIQQQSTRGCTAATAAMLIKDMGGSPDEEGLKICNLGNSTTIQRDILAAGLKPLIANCPKSLLFLRERLLADGSAIISINAPNGSHAIIIDHISSDLREARIRDPYHGWEITVAGDAILSCWHEGEIIQIHP